MTLRRAGLPLGLPPAASPPSADEIAEAVRIAIAEAPVGRTRDALTAFILAWRHRFPHTFARALGSHTAEVTAWAEASVDDPNHYLKLARIASAHLARCL